VIDTNMHIDFKKNIKYFSTEKIWTLLLFLCLYHYTPSYAQNKPDISNLKPWQLKSFAKNSVRVGDTYSAIHYYERLMELIPENINNAYKLADLYRNSRDYVKAEKAYEDCYNKDKIKFVDALFYHALMQKMNRKYDKAKDNFLKYVKESGKKGNPELKKQAKNEISGCDYYKSVKEAPEQIHINHLDATINKAHVEFSPLPLSETELLYGSLVADSVKYYSVNDSMDLPVRKFYKANKSGPSTWTGGLDSPLPFNDEKINTGNGAFSADRKRFYFTKCEPNWQNKMICSIFMSRFENGKWSEAIKLNKQINTPNYTATQPAVGIESKNKSEVLYFVSDRKGGRGGNDIWYAVYDPKKKEFREPRNAGSKLNTPGNEMTPYYDMESHTLFFSSTGWPGIGGLDVFSSVGEIKTWTPPKNFGPPLNSSADDIYFIRGINKEEGFFVSNREGGVSLQSATCCDDIYTFKYKKYIHLAISGNIFEVVDTSGLKYLEKISADTKIDEDAGLQNAAYDDIRKGNYKLLPHIPMTLWLLTAEGSEVPLKSDSTNDKGEYFFNLEAGNDYRLTAGSNNFFVKKINFSTKNKMVSDTLHKYIGIKRIPLGPIIIKNIYYPFDKAYLTPESQKTIDTTLFRFLNENPTTIVEVSSHTDSKGSDEYNVKLSQKRAESVVVYLTSKGIQADRLQAKGYGEEQPIAPNEKPDKSDNPDGRQMNRRTEFRIIGFLKEQEIIYED